MYFVGKFNTDMNSLAKRISYNSNEFDLESWTFGHLSVQDGCDILELGPGTGKQTRRMLERWPNSRITAVDLAEEALGSVNDERVRKVTGSFDEVDLGGPYDLIFSCYSLYYSKDMNALVSRLHGITKPGGTIALIGPGVRNNAELFDEVERLTGLTLPQHDGFLDVSSPPENFRVERMTNTIDFGSPEKLLDWWKNQNSFDEAVYERVRNDFQASKLTKSILGIFIDV